MLFIFINVAHGKHEIMNVAHILFLVGSGVPDSHVTVRMWASLPGCLVFPQLLPQRKSTYCVTFGIPRNLSEPPFLLCALQVKALPPAVRFHFGPSQGTVVTGR